MPADAGPQSPRSGACGEATRGARSHHIPSQSPRSYTLEPIASAVHRWDPMLPLFPAGHLARLAAFHARADRSPRLTFAGDYLIGPYTEMALTSGLRAATEIARAPAH